MFVFPVKAQVADSTVAASYNTNKVYAVNTAAGEALITIKKGSITVATLTLESQHAMVIGKHRTHTIEAAADTVKFTVCGTASK
jgi:hypothetical protein